MTPGTKDGNGKTTGGVRGLAGGTAVLLLAIGIGLLLAIVAPRALHAITGDETVEFVALGGLSGGAVTDDDGSHVAYVREDNDLVVRDVATGEETAGLYAAGHVWEYSAGFDLSSDGRLLAFTSMAPDLVPDDTNGTQDVFVRDLQTGAVSRVSVATDGTEGAGWSERPIISGNGRHVAFRAVSSNLSPELPFGLFLHDRVTHTTTPIPELWYATSISDDGRFVAGPGGDASSGEIHAYVYDTSSGSVTDAVVPIGGSDNGWHPEPPFISGNGRYAAFYSSESNLVEGDTNGQPDIFVRDLSAQTTTRVSVSSGGERANDWSWRPSVSNDGRYVTFWSRATNLVPDGPESGIYVHDRQTSTTTLVSRSPDGSPADGDLGPAAITGDGQRVVFTATSTNLGGNSDAGRSKVFMWGPQDGTVGADSVGIRIRGGVRYRNGGALSDGDFTVGRDERGITDVTGQGTLPGARGGTMTVSADITRLWRLPLHVGTVRIEDPSVGLRLSHPVIRGRIRPLGADGLVSNSYWFDRSARRWRPYRLTLTIHDLA